MNRKTIAVLMMVITVFTGFLLTGRQAMAAGYYDNVDADKLISMANDPASLAKVRSVMMVADESDKKIEKGVKLVTKCPNVEYAYICVNGLTLDKAFFNDLSTSSDTLSLSLQWCTVDLTGVKNPYVTTLYLMENTVKKYENIVNFKNLKELTTDTVTGFTQAEYSKLSRLELLSLSSQKISDYKAFFQQISKVRELGLECCNIQNKDTKYIGSYMKDLEHLNLFATFVDDISFLKDLKKLKGVTLPLGVSNLKPLYDVPYLEYVTFDAYTELFVDDDLMKFFDKNKINYPEHDKGIRKKVEKIIDSLKITDKTPVRDRIEKVTEYVLLHMKYDDSNIQDYYTSLDMCLNSGTGVCHDYSVFEYTLLKCAGVDAYMIIGYAVDAYGSPPGSHAWNEVCIDGKWYGLDATWIDSEQDDPTSDYHKSWAWPPCYMQRTKVNDPSEWPADLDFSDCQDLVFSYYHRTMNDPLDTLKGRGKAQTTTVNLNKSEDSIICGNTDSLKKTGSGILSKVTWKSSDTDVASVDSNGKITAKMAGTAVISATSAGKTASCKVTVLYKDVTGSKDFWYTPTNELTAKGIVKGYDKQTKFKPANECTRAQMVTFLYRLQGEPKTKSNKCQFEDVKSTDYFFKPVIWAVEKGITTGVSKTEFKPQAACTRAQTVTFLWRMANKPEPKTTKNPFGDVNEKDYFYKATLWASEKKIAAGYADGNFKPQGKCLRRQMVTFLYKYDKYINGKG